MTPKTSCAWCGCGAYSDAVPLTEFRATLGFYEDSAEGHSQDLSVWLCPKCTTRMHDCECSFTLSAVVHHLRIPSR